MSKPRIRPLAICVFRHTDASGTARLFAAEGYDAVKRQTFYRPLGGGIRFGETSAACLVRELREEIGAEVRDLRYLGTLENIFTFNGEPGHEIVLVYDGAFADARLYTVDGVEGREDDDVVGTFRAVWLSIAALRAPGAPPLYPDGLLALLDSVPLKTL